MFGISRKTQIAEHNFVGMSKGQEPASVGRTVDFSRFHKLINFCLYALVLLTPILFSSLTSEAREFNKQSFIFFAVVVMLGAWIVKILTTRSMSWVRTSLDYILLVYLGVYLLTSLLSVDKVSSFLGYYGRFTGSFISVLSLVVMYYLIVNNLKKESTVKRLTNFYLIGSALVLVYSFFQLLGAYILPFAFTHDRGFNPIGSLVGLGIYAALSVVIVQWMFFIEPKRSKLKTLSLIVLMLVALAVLLLVNAFVAWLVLALAMVAFMAIAMAIAGEHQSSPTWFWKPMIVLVIGVLFVAFQFLPSGLNPRNLININLPIEIQLSNATTWRIVGNSMKSGPKTALLGSGPGTTGIQFGRIKPQELNKTIVWSLNFDRASSEVANIAIENGILGLLVFELASLLFLVYGLYFLLKKSAHLGWKYALGFFTLWLALYITHFFYFFNTTFYFLYWFSIAVFMAVSHMTNHEEEQKDISFSSSPRSALSWMFVSLLLLAALLIGAFFQATIYGGELAYASGLRLANQNNPNLSDISDKFNRAINLNPYRDVYYLALGQTFILRAQQESAKPKPDSSVIQNLMASLISTGQQAVAVSPAKASNWQALSQFYADIKPLASNADSYIISSLKSAIDNDPNNPALHYQLGQAYFGASQVPDQQDKTKTKTDPEMVKNAENELNRALELKSDLPEFYIQLSRVLETDNKPEEARKKMDEAASMFPSNPDVLFEDGRLAFNAKDIDNAQTIFLNVVALSPDYANAHYSLGLIYQQKGEKDKARGEFQKTRDIVGDKSPDAANLDKLIESLK